MHNQTSYFFGLRDVLLSFVDTWQDADSFLVSAARKKFDTGLFLPDTVDTEPDRAPTRDARRPDLPPRSCSVLGVHAPDRSVDGALRGGAETQLGLDYVDLEQLLLEKMLELKVRAATPYSSSINSRGKFVCT